MDQVNRKRRGHDFLPPQEVLRKIPKLYMTDGTPAEDKTIYLHYFCGGSDWWIAELNLEDNIAFGYVCLGGRTRDAEWGYIDLKELEEVYRPPFTIVERDMHWKSVLFHQIKS